MLKYQVRNSSTSRSSPSSYGTASPSSSSSNGSQHDVTLLTTSRSNSLVSLNSLDSSGPEGDWGVLKVYTSDIRQCTDYKTIRVSTKTTARNVIEMVLTKFKLTCRDPNLFELWMELTTKAEGKPVKTILRLENDAKPLELQRCHPAGMSRFLLHMNATGTLVRVYDHNICAASNYKSLMLSSLTNCEEAIDLILAQNRKSREESANYGLFLTTPEAEAQIPPEVSIVSVYVLSQPQHKIVIRPLDSL